MQTINVEQQGAVLLAPGKLPTQGLQELVVSPFQVKQRLLCGLHEVFNSL